MACSIIGRYSGTGLIQDEAVLAALGMTFLVLIPVLST
jgi:hypothetical protein